MAGSFRRRTLFCLQLAVLCCAANLTPMKLTQSRPQSKVPAELKAKIEEKVKAVKDAVAEEDTDKIKATSDDLSKEVMNLGAAVYGQGGAQQPGAAGPEGAQAGGAAGGAAGSSGGKGDDNVVDAEFEEKK